MVKEDRSDWVAVAPDSSAGGAVPPPIKHAKSAYAFFQKENASKIAQELSTAGSTTDVGALGKEVSSRWQNLSSTEKKKYEDMAIQDKNRFLAESHKRDVEVMEQRQKLLKERDTLILDDQGEGYGGRTTRKSRQKGQRKAERKRTKKEEKKRAKKAVKAKKPKKAKKSEDDSDYEDGDSSANSDSSYDSSSGSSSASSSSVSSDDSSSDEEVKKPAKRSVQVSQAVLGKCLQYYVQIFWGSIPLINNLTKYLSLVQCPYLSPQNRPT